MEKILNQILDELKGVKKDVSDIKEDVSILKQDVSGLKQDVELLKDGQARLELKQERMDAKLDAVYHQTAELTEDRAKMRKDIDYILYEQTLMKKDIYHIKEAIK